MYAPILLAFLVFASPAVADSPSSSPTEPLKVTVGNMSFSGDTIKLVKSDNETLECEIDGRAEFTTGNDGDTDITVAAQRIVITRNADLEVSIDCTGDCKLADADRKCCADRMQLRFPDAGPSQGRMLGNVRMEMEYDAGESRTTITAKSITFEGGSFIASASASINPGQ